jgi:hypothetical protein
MGVQRKRLRRSISRRPREFLKWDVVTGSMFVGNEPYVDRELQYLKGRPDWKSVWEGVIREDPSGGPKLYKGYRQSSGNRIHQAYHLARFEQETGLSVGRFPLIVEFGGGYGSLCRIIHKLGFQGQYVIFDLPEFAALQKFYLGLLGLPLVREREVSSGDPGILCTSELPELDSATRMGAKQGLFIATWSLSETGESLREHVVKLPGIEGAAAYLIAYQRDFGGVDNPVSSTPGAHKSQATAGCTARSPYARIYYLFGGGGTLKPDTTFATAGRTMHPDPGDEDALRRAPSGGLRRHRHLPLRRRDRRLPGFRRRGGGVSGRSSSSTTPRRTARRRSSAHGTPRCASSPTRRTGALPPPTTRRSPCAGAATSSS